MRPDPWLIEPDDGIIDQVAIVTAAAGLRDVRLTAAERRLAAALIMRTHGKTALVCSRIHVNIGTANAILADVSRETSAAAAPAGGDVSRETSLAAAG